MRASAAMTSDISGHSLCSISKQQAGNCSAANFGADIPTGDEKYERFPASEYEEAEHGS
jgi:hypothetical protein